MCFRCHILALSILVCGFGAASGQVFTQKPEVSPTQIAAEPVAPRKALLEAAALEQGPTPLWIWGADANQRYFLRKEFTGGARVALLKATCDNLMTVFVNGQAVARSDEWQSPVEVDVTKYLKPDTNVLLAEVGNAGGVAGFILKLALIGDKKETRHVVSDETWQVAAKKDTDKWVAARKVGKLGDAPWGNAFSLRGGGGAPAASGAFQLLPGFQVERLFTVPKDKLGSWVCIAFDNKGRLLASDQGNLGICRITLPRPGSDEETKVEKLNLKITAAQGMLHAFGSLYLSVNGGPGSGLYRARDTDGDDQYDEVVKLKALQGGGEHGPHALRLSPDGKSILVMCGNHTQPPFEVQRNRPPLTLGGVGTEQLRATLPEWATSRIPANWDEDLLLPRQWDANGHARGILAPGGYVARTDPDGKTWEMLSVGYRNAYDMAFNADGELFGYDSDMEWDMGMPWYRPTRVNHAVSGSEFGWRSGTGVWPAYYPDSLPPMLDIGPGSPVGVEFGYGTKFPAKYQKALYILDWTFGTMYALHLEPDGATYKAVKEEFVARAPLPLTDAAVGPDGALYFTIGGRGTQSELFRVTYAGKESTERVDGRDPRAAELRALRRQLEQYHAPAADPAKAVAFIYPHLGHEDRFIRYAARVALEHQPIKLWQDKVLDAPGTHTVLQGAVALARQGDKSLQPKLLAALDRFVLMTDEELLKFGVPTPGTEVPFNALFAAPKEEFLDLLRAYQLVFIRTGEPDKAVAAKLVAKLDRLFPTNSDNVNRELVQLLVFLKSPTVISKTLALMQQPSKPLSAEALKDLLARNRGYAGPIERMMANAPDLQKLHYGFVLRNAREGWTLEQRRVYFAWLAEARAKSGGNSYQGFLNNIEKDAFDNATDTDRLAIEAAGLRKPFKPKELPKPVGPGREYKMAELLALESKLQGRNFQNGQKMYAAARCVVCHRYNGDGGATGPDLTQLAGRFNLKDLSESLVEPSKVISDQYRASTIVTTAGKVYTGKVVSETKDGLTVVIDPEDSTKVVDLKKADVDEMKASPTSLMPQDLLKTLNEDEVLDLLAYLLSRGDPKHAMFRK